MLSSVKSSKTSALEQERKAEESPMPRNLSTLSEQKLGLKLKKMTKTYQAETQDKNMNLGKSHD
jgi:hypothetical protein